MISINCQNKHGSHLVLARDVKQRGWGTEQKKSFMKSESMSSIDWVDKGRQNNELSICLKNRII